MADVLLIPFTEIPDNPVYVQILNMAGEVWNGSAFVTWNSSNYATYCIPLSRKGTSRYYSVSVPGLPAGVYYVAVWMQAVVTPTTYSEDDDELLDSGTLEWDGTNVVPLSSRATQAALAVVDQNVDDIEVAADAILVDTGTSGVAIAPDAIGASQIAANAIGASEIADNAIDAGAIAADAIGASEIATDAIGALEVADGAVDAGAIATGAVDADAVADNAIDAGAIAADAIGASEVATDAIAAAEIAASAVSEIQSGLATASAVANVQSDVDDIQSKIGTPAGASLAADIAAAKTVIDAVLVDTGTDLPASLSTINGLATAIKAKTDNLPSDPADQSILAGALANLEDLVDAVKLRTDLIPDDPATEATLAALDTLLDTIHGKIDTIDANVDDVKAVLVKVDDLLESDGSGGWRLTEDALVNAPSGGGGGGGPTVQEIVDGLLDEAIAGHLTPGSVGDAIFVAAVNAADAASRASTVLTRLGVPVGASISADIAAAKTNIDAVLVDTGTDLPATLATIAGYLDTEVAAILAKVNNLPLDPADASDVAALIASLSSIASAIKAKTDELQFDGDGMVLADAQKIGGNAPVMTGGKLWVLDSNGNELNTSAVLSRLGTPAGASIAADIAAVKAQTAGIQQDTSTNLPASIAAVAGFLGTDIAAIKAKTDNLPSDPADQSVILQAISDVEDLVTLVKERSDLIPDDPATETTLAALDSLLDSLHTKADAIAANVVAVLEDTAALSTDWANGGRLDLLLDAMKAVLDQIPNGGAMSDLATLTSRLTATRAGYLDNLAGHVAQSGDAFARLGAPTGASVSADIAAAKTQIAEIEEDTGTDIPLLLNSILGLLDTEIAAIKARTDKLPVDTEASLNALSALSSAIKTVTDRVSTGLEETSSGSGTWRATVSFLSNAPTGGGGGGGDATLAKQEEILAKTDQILDELDSDSQPTGPGRDPVTLEIKSNGRPVVNASVWITETSAREPVIAGTLLTNAEGKVRFLLTHGNQYHLWMEKPGVNPILGRPFVANRDP